VGATSGYLHWLKKRRWVATLLDQVTGVVWALPGLILFIVITTRFGYAAPVISLTLGVVTWVPIARVVRLEIERELRREYVTMHRAMGMPVCSTVSAVLATVRPAVGVTGQMVFLDLIGAEASLSFLGLGVQPPSPSLGGMIYTGLYYSQTAWWLLVVPAATLLFTLWLIRRPGNRHSQH